MYFTLINCNDKKYCIPLDNCQKGKFIINYKAKTCERKTDCSFNFFDGTDPFINDNNPDPTSQVTDTPLTPDEKEENILKRTIIVKILNEESSYLNYNDCDEELIENYLEIYNKNLEGYEEDGIYLILLKKYKNFNITIYPLDIESFSVDNVLVPNNLNSINFENYLKGYLNYEMNKNEILLIILLARKDLNSSINDLNYYFYSMNENHNERSRCIDVLEENIEISDINLLKVNYYLKNYFNSNSALQKRNTEYLIDNIRNIY